MATLFYFSLLNINNTDGLFIPRIINTFAALIKSNEVWYKKHIYLILLFILSFTVETAQSQEVTNIHIAATDTVPTYTSDSAVINFLKDAGIPITQNSKLKLLKSGRAKFIDLFEEIRHAKHHIHLEYFNFRNDSIANALFDLLGEKWKKEWKSELCLMPSAICQTTSHWKRNTYKQSVTKESKLSSSTLSNSPISIMPCTETIARL